MIEQDSISRQRKSRKRPKDLRFVFCSLSCSHLVPIVLKAAARRLEIDYDIEFELPTRLSLLLPKSMTWIRTMKHLALLVVCTMFCSSGIAQEPTDFAHDVLPLLKTHCAKCHTNGTYKGSFSMDSRGKLIESGLVTAGESNDSEMFARVISDDPELRMPKGGQLTKVEIDTLRKWIDDGLPWEEGFSFKEKVYKARLSHRRPELPDAIDGRSHPIDRIVDAYLAKNQINRTDPSTDAQFLRRVSLDLVGELPSQTMLDAFKADKDSKKRERLVQLMLDDSVGYADHWITFWNDLLRNDYKGTGFIDGGRKQITPWLYDSLIDNKPYDQFVRELISPTSDSEGFIKGIKWRGRVNASQVPPLQFAQNISQVMLGINLKCASCHDSFINDWKLNDAYGLAAIISDEPLEIHRCDKPTGKFAKAAFVFPELGEINADKSRPERLAELSQLITSEKNGRLARTIVNRLWDRLMGRGIVHPVDIMSNQPWSEDLLDYLAIDLVDHGYDLKRTLFLITTSEIYQAETVPAEPEVTEDDYRFRGPTARRITAEQFQDAVWTLTNSGPKKPAGKFGFRAGRKVRASLVESNLLTRALGRPNREQVVTTRPAELTTLQALDLTNGDVLADQLEKASGILAKQFSDQSIDGVIRNLYRQALSREPNEAELQAAAEMMGDKISAAGIADLYWAVLMLPEFQMVR